MVAYHLERGGMSLHDVVGVNCEMIEPNDIKAQVASIWAKR